ncbi:hypothetical protein BCON_0018g00230 [Botryotinia convoluta]|uniref:Uncharacterized protein n=1 Tax=Botryotinia convoluta TaxID=54673 RepID=A0A4Z1ITF4_9HELO|nr:hypothetical protein BCON_0018g00230 [Botryotinia convoluta]
MSRSRCESFEKWAQITGEMYLPIGGSVHARFRYFDVLLPERIDFQLGPHIIKNEIANAAGEKIDSVTVTIVDVICSILAYQCPWALVHLLDCSVEKSYISIDAFDETHCGYVARDNRKVQVVFNDLASEKRWHYDYEILDDGQWILAAPEGFELETLVKHLIENEWLGNNVGFIRERNRPFEKPHL